MPSTERDKEASAVTGSRAEAKYDAVIIGGGHNGLVCAWYLAEAGNRVLVLERREEVGGACATEQLFEGVQVSSCAYVCWMLQRKVIDDLQLRAHGFRYWPLDPIMCAPAADGTAVRYCRDPRRTQGDLERVSTRDAARHRDWEEMWSWVAKILRPYLLKSPPTREDLLRRAEELGKHEPLQRLFEVPLAELSAEHFETPAVQAATVSVGEVGDPWMAGSAWAESYFHLAETDETGFAVVEGGMGAITQAMARSALAAGAEIRTTTSVAEVLVDETGALGVRLSDGKEIRSRTVVSNADPKRTLLQMVPDDATSAEFREQIKALSTRVSYLKFHCVMDRRPDLSRYDTLASDPTAAAYIKISPSLEHYRAAYESVSAGEPAAEPIVHIQVPSVYDETLTDRDVQVVSLWAQFAPPQLALGTWEDRRDSVGERLIDYVSEYIPNFRRDMREWRLFTPADLEQRVGLTDGNIRHLDTIPGQLFGDRPLPGIDYETPVRSLFLCGAGTHPGGEVTGAPGHNSARVVLERLRTA
jgi:phytoene dehydrogenase-like protein